MIKLNLGEAQNIIGFTVGNAGPGEKVGVQTKDWFTSDHPFFYTHLKKISEIFLGLHGIFPDQVFQFLVIIHEDRTGELYLNEEVETTADMILKKNVQDGEVVYTNDIADVRRLKFNARVNEDDKVLFCFKIGWKFAFFYDLGRPDSKLDMDRMSLTLGSLYSLLRFEHIYKTLESESLSGKLFKDGWFPFIEILGSDYEALTEIYLNTFGFKERINQIIDSFNEERINKIIKKWSMSPVFKEKELIITAGVKAYLQDTDSGYITCIKTLATEIEGIMRNQYLVDTGTALGGIKAVINFIIEKAKNKIQSESSLFLPEYFLNHLYENVFAHFEYSSIANDEAIALSRHSVSHGAASPGSYTKQAALQMILNLDQIFFYIR